MLVKDPRRWSACVPMGLVAMALLLVLTMVPGFAWADEGVPVVDPVPQESVVLEGVTEVPAPEQPAAEVPVEGEAAPAVPESPQLVDEVPSEPLSLMGNDYVWFGESMTLEGAAVPNDVIAAGRSVRVDNCQVAGGVRAAAQSITISDTTVNQNVTVAAQDVTIDDGQAKVIAAACSTFNYSGSCARLTVFAGTVFIDGTVEGDVRVEANKVTIGSNARIRGTLSVTSSEEPVMEPGSEVATVDLVIDSSDGEDSAATADAFMSVWAILRIVFRFVGTILVAILAEWLFGGHTAAAARMLRTRTGVTIGSGVIGTLAAPCVILLLCVLVLTLPVAGILTLALLTMALVGCGFMGASVSKLAFPSLGRYVCALLGGAVVGLLRAIPYLGTLVALVAYVYLLGYVLQTIYLGLRKEGPATGAPKDPTADDFMARS